MQKSLDWQRMNNTITMEQTNKLVPELRFPEFVKDGEWEENEVGKFFKFKTHKHQAHGPAKGS